MNHDSLLPQSDPGNSPLTSLSLTHANLEMHLKSAWQQKAWDVGACSLALTVWGYRGGVDNRSSEVSNANLQVISELKSRGREAQAIQPDLRFDLQRQHSSTNRERERLQCLCHCRLIPGFSYLRYVVMASFRAEVQFSCLSIS